MNYIVFDLEWNQADFADAANTVKELPFEIIDIGAVKLNHERYMVDEFDQLVKPQVYSRMHYITSQIIHLHMRDLMKGKPFPKMMAEFLAWCGDDYIFCTWGDCDLVELQRNMRYYFMPLFSDGPFRYLDVQKLFSIAYEDRKSRRSLESAIDFLHLQKDIPFHRAFSDAYYTAKILAELPEGVLANYSYDTFVLPRSRGEEIYTTFENYHKYISVEFPGRGSAVSDREVMSTRCYLCGGRHIKRKIKWFSTNGRQFHSVAYCPVHGYMKSKLRLKKAIDHGIYVVKTAKFIDEKRYLEIRERKAGAMSVATYLSKGRHLKP